MEPSLYHNLLDCGPWGVLSVRLSLAARKLTVYGTKMPKFTRKND